VASRPAFRSDHEIDVGDFIAFADQRLAEKKICH
jgi:hypothetical protein